MGGSSSKSKVHQERNTFVTNRSDINILNEKINNTIVNTTVQNVKNCSASLVNNQRLKIIGVVAGEDIIISNQQIQEGMMDFSCVQTDEVKNDVAKQMIDQIMQQLQSTVDTSVIDKLNAVADSKSSQDWGAFPWGGADSKSNVKQIVNTNINNMTSKNIQNVVKNAVESNFTSATYNDCLSTVINNQEFEARDLQTGRTVRITNQQEQSAKLFAKCVQNSNIANSITDNITNFFGLDVKEDTKNSTDATVSGESTSEAVSTGLFQGVADMFRGVGDMFGGLFSSILPNFGGVASLSSPISSICCCLIIILIVVLMFTGGKSSTEGTTTGTMDYGDQYNAAPELVSQDYSMGTTPEY